MECRREPVEQVDPPAQHFDHAGRDRAIGSEVDGNEAVDAPAGREGEVDGSVAARDVECGAVAQARLDELVSRVQFSSFVHVLGTGEADGCGSNSAGALFTTQGEGFFCGLGWTAVIVIPSADTREELAAAVDAEFAAMDVPYNKDSMVRSFVELNPTNRPGLPMAGGGDDGQARIEAKAEVFHPEFWRRPRPITPSSDVTSEGNLDKVTADLVGASSAYQVVTVSISIGYWNIDGVGMDALPALDPLTVTHSAYGDRYAFDLALAEPTRAADGCLADPAIDASTIVAVEMPFRRLQFSLLPDAVGLDMQRVRDCLSTRLSAGALVVLTPYE